MTKLYQAVAALFLMACVELDSKGLGLSDTSDSDGSTDKDFVCGNNIVEPGEECDGISLDGVSCADFGGKDQDGLLCTQDCLFDKSNCILTNHVKPDNVQ